MAQKGVEQYFIPRKRRLPGSFKEPLKDNCDIEPGRQTKRLKQDPISPAGTSRGADTHLTTFHRSRKHVLASLKGSTTEDSAVKMPPASPKCVTFSATATEFHRTSKTPKSIQRKLFTDDEEDNFGEQSNNFKSKAAVIEPEPKVPVKQSSSKLPQGMSPQKMKESLMDCSKIQQLKAKLADFNNASARLKQFQEGKKSLVDEGKPAASKSVEFVISSPVKTPKKFPQTPSPKKTPAYKRFQHLIKESRASLQLPHKYRFLKEAFHCLDTVCSFLHNRKEIITFKKLKTSVQEMLNRTFTEKELAQIKAVFPFAYIFRREKNIPNHKVTPNNKNKYQLTVHVNTEYARDMKGHLVQQSPKTPRVYKKLSPAMLLERGRVFHASLLDILIQHHQEFLHNLDPPVTVDPTHLTRWHAEFPLELVPDIARAPLPRAPADDMPNTARDVLERAQSVFSKYPKLQQCLKAVAGENENLNNPGNSGSVADPSPVASTSMETEKSASTAAAPDPEQKGLPTGLLARIRAREAARQARQMTRTPEQTRRIEMLSRLPALVRSLRAAFISERRAALPLETTVARLVDSCRSQLSSDELAEHVRLLAAEAPSFLQILQLKAGTFAKMNRDMDVNQVVKQLEVVLEKLKK